MPSCTGSSGAIPNAGMPSANIGPAILITFSTHWLSLGSDAEQGLMNDAAKEISGQLIVKEYLLCLVTVASTSNPKVVLCSQ